MTPRLARILTRLYPPAWRDRYGEEFAAMLEMGPGDPGTVADSVWSALREHIIPTRGGKMGQDTNSFGAMMRRPSAYLPVAMSLAALAMVLGAVAVGLARGGHIVRDPDEGSVAHLFQILMTVQWPITLFFVVKWLRRAPRQTLGVLGLQAAAWLAGCVPVYFLHL
jgi:hypothetical protein